LLEFGSLSEVYSHPIEVPKSEGISPLYQGTVKKMLFSKVTLKDPTAKSTDVLLVVTDGNFSFYVLSITPTTPVSMIEVESVGPIHSSTLTV
jgi:hypothetical protein